AGADLMQGGKGNDVYGVDNVNDQVVEQPGEGVDTIYATVDYKLGAGQEVEYLLASGPAGLKLTGNELAHNIYGGAGNDTLVGGAGSDTFVFGAASGNDVIQDFQPGTDHVDVSAWAIPDFNTLMASASESNGSTTITLSPTDAIHLAGVHKSDLHSADF